MIDSSLYTFLAANVGDGWSVEEGKVDFDRTPPWIFFRRSYTQQETALSGALFDNFISDFDVEVVSNDIDAAQNQADSLKTALQTITPGSVVGATFCQAVMVFDHTDDYIPFTVLDTDTGLHLCSFQIHCYHCA